MSDARHAERLSPWNAADYLNSEGDIAAYLEAATAEGGEDPEYMAKVQADVAKARAALAANK